LPNGWTVCGRRHACPHLRGDWQSVGGGLGELRIDHGPGDRVYYGQEGKTFILLLCGGDKSTQAKDIERAHAYWKLSLMHWAA
jgi:putative addiction module killer protein